MEDDYMSLEEITFKKCVIGNTGENNKSGDKDIINDLFNSSDKMIEQNVEQNAEIYEEPFSDEELMALGSDKSVMYKTQDVSNILGISTQTVRNYLETFENYLDIEKTPGGHRLYTAADIEKLRNIIKLKTERKLTMKQTLEFLQGEDDPDVVISPDKRFEYLTKLLVQTVNNAVQDVLESNVLTIEEKNHSTLSEYKEIIEEMNVKLDERDAVILKLVEENKKYSEKLSQIEQATSENQGKLLEEIREIMEEKKKRKFFSWKK